MWTWLIVGGAVLGSLVLLVIWSLLEKAAKGEEALAMGTGCKPVPPRVGLWARWRRVDLYYRRKAQLLLDAAEALGKLDYEPASPEEIEIFLLQTAVLDLEMAVYVRERSRMVAVAGVKAGEGSAGSIERGVIVH